MIIFPDIEIQNGRSVNRIHGKEKEPEIYDISPLAAAQEFVAAGAERLHVIDLDSSYKFGHFNSELICEIIKSVDVPVQVGGGICTLSDVDWWFEHGAARVVLGTVAVLDRLLTMDACGRHPGKIVISITGKNGYAMIDGWSTKTSFTTLELAKSFENSGAGAIIYTDLDRFEGGQAVGLASTIEIGTELGIPLISTGTVYSLDDVSILSLLPNIEGVIIGRALFQGTVDLAEAIEAARTSRVAPELATEGVAPRIEDVSGVPGPRRRLPFAVAWLAANTAKRLGVWLRGTPLNEFGATIIDPSYHTFVVPRGTAGRLPDIWDLSLRLTYDLGFLFDGERGARFLLDFLHIGSPTEVTNQEQKHYLAQDDQGNQTSPNPTYGAATAYQPPFAMRLGAQIYF